MYNLNEMLDRSVDTWSKILNWDRGQIVDLKKCCKSNLAAKVGFDTAENVPSKALGPQNREVVVGTAS